MTKFITVKGADTNNLKHIDVSIPREKITALVGVSGAGKSSLAFDTIYAEGYLRYIESISPYIRQFLDKIEKPPIESIDGLPPAISFKHKKPAKNPRSIVSTSLDVFDYLRILFAKIADFYCPGCGKEIKQYSIDEIIPQLLEHFPGKVEVCFPYQGDIAFLINRGYYFYIHPELQERQRIDHQVKDKPIYVLIDRIETIESNKSRLFEALDKSISLGNGNACVFYQEQTTVGEGERRLDIFPSSLYCSDCDVLYPSPDEHLFSFNSPKGACHLCKGFGDIQTIDPEVIFDKTRSLVQGAALPFNSPATRGYRAELLENAQLRGIDIHKPVGSLKSDEIEYLMEGEGFFGGVRGFFDWLKTKSYKVHARVFISRYTVYKPCPDCGGTRFNDVTRGFKIKDKNIADFLDLTIAEAADFMRSLEPEEYNRKVSSDVFHDIQSRLDFLVYTGLPYLHLNRPTFTLSRGEYQRINLAFILGSTLSDSLLILDQPSSDLHPHDYEKLLSFLTRLKENGNTLLLVEHNPDVVRLCDEVIELGPFAGDKGGQVVWKGETKPFFQTAETHLSSTGDLDNHNLSSSTESLTLTQHFFLQPPVFKENQNALKQWVKFEAADSHNLKGFQYRIPKGAFTVVAGVSGAGKTTLLYNEMYLKNQDISAKKSSLKGIKDIVFIDPGLQRMRTGSIVAGYFEVFHALREMFAALKESQILHYTVGHFSFNSASGRCPQCNGKGYNQIEMQFLPTVQVRCNSCNGSGYQPDILKIRFKEKNIREILDLSIEAFIELVGDTLPAKKTATLNALKDNGLGYIRLGQPLNTLSAGELQRLKLLKHLDSRTKNTLFLIDEPTFGMHAYDIQMIKKLIDRLVQNGNTVVAAEHNLDLMSHADYLIELGPGGGENGGNLLFQGPSMEIFNCNQSMTANYIKKNKKKT